MLYLVIRNNSFTFAFTDYSSNDGYMVRQDVGHSNCLQFKKCGTTAPSAKALEFINCTSSNQILERESHPEKITCFSKKN